MDDFNTSFTIRSAILPSRYFIPGPDMEPLCRERHTRGNIIVYRAIFLAQLRPFHVVEPPEEITQSNIQLAVCQARFS